MQLTLWTYEGPPHVGAMRIATAMKGLHYVLHAPQGDTYADLLFTMIERRNERPPVTYTTFRRATSARILRSCSKTHAPPPMSASSHRR
jgi:light-independent protochlorophyllide reductase subunit B